MIQNAANSANSQSESNAQATATAQAEAYTEVVMKKVGEQIDQLNGRIANNVNLNNAPKKSTEEALTVDYTLKSLVLMMDFTHLVFRIVLKVAQMSHSI